jgi:hypothetical protein
MSVLGKDLVFAPPHIRSAAARDELVRAHWFSLNSGQSEGLIPLPIASISTSLYGIHQNNHDFYIGGHRIACTHRSYLSYSSLAPDWPQSELVQFVFVADPHISVPYSIHTSQFY